MAQIDIEKLTDIVELKTWASGNPITLSSLKEQVETSTGPNSGIDEDPYATALRVMTESLARKTLLGGKYPFDSDGNKISFIKQKSTSAPASTYMFCTALSHYPSNKIKSNIRQLEFETVAMNAATTYFSGTGIRTGAPWRVKGIPTYKHLLTKICDVAPELGAPKATKAPGGGDGGWDVVVVNHFPDYRYPQLIILGNCATGRQDFRTKGSETSTEHFMSTLFDFAPRSPVLEFFAVPFLLTDDERSRKTSNKRVLFDRMRLSHFCPAVTDSAKSWLYDNRQSAINLPLL